MPKRYQDYTGVITSFFQALHALFPEKNSLDEYRVWYRDSVIQKIKERSWKYEGVPGTYIDIVNVINATSVHWAADRMVKFPLLHFFFFHIEI
jgi:linoleate 10R-lipoxygenase